ncbi:hypothetical protein CALVIDRAFT_416603 [Calocera viscosa TUFC12733]|uniref:Uncharacterized protein n=1 Tax=Calocera viscosa (strain TUFC12733) TaxID=1330018 RepID=A0A167PEZ4_CALVF|nr:hypothetical protein CALVIDRAFT_416603 [Calocera viscosa TUFC12733]
MEQSLRRQIMAMERSPRARQAMGRSLTNRQAMEKYPRRATPATGGSHHLRAPLHPGPLQVSLQLSMRLPNLRRSQIPPARAELPAGGQQYSPQGGYAQAEHEEAEEPADTGRAARPFSAAPSPVPSPPRSGGTASPASPAELEGHEASPSQRPLPTPPQDEEVAGLDEEEGSDGVEEINGGGSVHAERARAMDVHGWGRGAGGSRATGSRTPASTQASMTTRAYHGPERRGLYRPMDLSWSTMMDHQREVADQVREREEELLQLFTLVILTSKDKHIFPGIRAVATSSGLSTCVSDWPQLVNDVLAGTLGTEFKQIDDIYIFDPDQGRSGVYGRTTLRMVIKAERVIARLAGVADDNFGLQEELAKLVPLATRDARRGSKRTRAHSPSSSPPAAGFACSAASFQPALEG